MCGSERQWLRARIEIRLVRRSQPCCRQVRCVCHSEPGSRYHGLWAALPTALGSHRQEGPFQKEPDSSLVCLDYVIIVCCPEEWGEDLFFLLAFSRLGLHSPGLRWPPIQRATCHAFWGLELKVCTITLGREPKPSYINSCVGQCREGVGGEEWNEAQEHFCLKHKL